MVGGAAGRGSGVGAGLVLAEVGQLERYDQSAAFVGADVYTPLAPRLYANARARLAPGTEVAPQSDVGAEVYAAVGKAWEVSAGARRLAFADRAVGLVTASAAGYSGPWLGRLRLTVVPNEGRVPVSAAVSVRRLASGRGATASFWEITAGRGQEATVEARGQTAVRESWFAAARLQRPLASGVGVVLGGGYTIDDDLSRASVEAGVFARW